MEAARPIRVESQDERVRALLLASVPAAQCIEGQGRNNAGCAIGAVKTKERFGRW